MACPAAPMSGFLFPLPHNAFKRQPGPVSIAGGGHNGLRNIQSKVIILLLCRATLGDRGVQPGARNKI